MFFRITYPRIMHTLHIFMLVCGLLSFYITHVCQGYFLRSNGQTIAQLQVKYNHEIGLSVVKEKLSLWFAPYYQSDEQSKRMCNHAWFSISELYHILWQVYWSWTSIPSINETSRLLYRSGNRFPTTAQCSMCQSCRYQPVICLRQTLNSSPPGQNGRRVADEIFNCISWMKMMQFRFMFHWNIFPRAQVTIRQHLFR